MAVKDALHELSEGDKLTVDTHSQTFTVTNVMFGGEMVDVEGPQGGEKSLVENVNSGSVKVVNGDKNEGVVSEINV